MGQTARENFIIDKATGDTFKSLADALAISKAELFRRMVKAEAEKNKELLQKWQELEKLRK